MQWIPSFRSEECRVVRAYFYSVLEPFFLFNFEKCMSLAVSHLTVTLRMMSRKIADHSLLLVLYMYNSFFNRYVTPRMKYSSMRLHAGWLLPFLELSAIGTVILPAWSIGKWALITNADLQLSLGNCRVTAKWRTAAGRFLKSSVWNLTQKGLNICSGKGKNLNLSTRIIIVHSQTRDTSFK